MSGKQPWWERGSAVAALALLLNGLAASWYAVLSEQTGSWVLVVIVLSFLFAVLLGALASTDKPPGKTPSGGNGRR